MTQHVAHNYQNITKYKRARHQVLDQIKNNQRGLNYVIQPNNQQIDQYNPTEGPVPSNEVELGSNGEYVLSQNQIITSPDGVDYKIV